MVCLGVMMLQEEGLVNLSDPIEKHLPEFRGQQVLEGNVLRKPARLVTLLGEPFASGWRESVNHPG